MYGIVDVDLETEGYANALGAETRHEADDLVANKLSQYAISAATLIGVSYGLDVFTSFSIARLTNARQDPNEYLSSEGQERVGSVIDTEEVWNDIAENPDQYSGQDIVERLHAKVMIHLDYDDSFADTGIDPAVDDGSGICFDFSGMTYSALLKLAADHPEIAEQAQDVRWVFGASGEENIGHAWLHVRGEDGVWHNYDPTVDYVENGMGNADIVHQYPPVDMGKYIDMGSVQQAADGTYDHDMVWKNILMPKMSAGEQLLNMYEMKTGNDIPNDIEQYLPETFILVAGTSGITSGVKWTFGKIWDWIKGRRGGGGDDDGDGDDGAGGLLHRLEEMERKHRQKNG
jgi:hypothetical protein